MSARMERVADAKSREGKIKEWRHLWPMSRKQLSAHRFLPFGMSPWAAA